MKNNRLPNYDDPTWKYATYSAKKEGKKYTTSVVSFLRICFYRGHLPCQGSQCPSESKWLEIKSDHALLQKKK